VTDRSNTALSLLVKSQQMRKLDLLLSRGPNLDLHYDFENDGWHTLLCCCGKNILKRRLKYLLLRNGADPFACLCSMEIIPDLVESVWGQNRDSLHFSVIKSRKNEETYQLFLVRLEMATEAEINGQDSQGWTPLHVAAFFNCPEAVKKLLKMGATMDTQTKQGWSALIIAVNKGFQDVIHALLTSKNQKITD